MKNASLSSLLVITITPLNSKTIIWISNILFSFREQFIALYFTNQSITKQQQKNLFLRTTSIAHLKYIDETIHFHMKSKLLK